MAFPLSVPNDFADGEAIEADEHDANFAAIVAWANTEAIWADGSVAFTAIPSGPASDPTGANELSRKAYVDAKAGGVVSRKQWYGAGGLLTVATGADMGDWKGMSAGLAITETLDIPELTTTKQAALGVAPRIAAAILNSADDSGAVLQRSVSEHGTADQGQHMHVEYLFQASATEELDFFPVVTCLTFGADPTFTAKVRVLATYPVVFALEDLGTGA